MDSPVISAEWKVLEADRHRRRYCNLPDWLYPRDISAGKSARALIAPNMSVGVNVLMKIAREGTKILGNFDAHVLEIHHRTKIDAPRSRWAGLSRKHAPLRSERDRCVWPGRHQRHA